MTQLYPDSGQNNDCVIFVFDCINKSVFFIEFLEQHVSKCRIRTLLLLMMLRPVICDFLHDFKILRLFTVTSFRSESVSVRSIHASASPLLVSFKPFACSPTLCALLFSKQFQHLSLGKLLAQKVPEFFHAVDIPAQICTMHCHGKLSSCADVPLSCA